MCGIAGSVFWGDVREDPAVRAMTASLAHRGPDDGDVVSGGGATLGHRRLAIIDLNPRARQPMKDSTGGRWIVYNGEIYNFRELRRTLRSCGVDFRTSSDTEVILEAYNMWGLEAIARLDGMFAFAIWDHRDQRLVLARDRVGEKPLYYQVVPGTGLIFASDLRALRKHPLSSTDVNLGALGQ